MGQDLVTAKDVAAPNDVALQFQDAQLICDILDEALAKESYGRVAYSQSVRSLFQVAWAAASHTQNVQVTVYHLAYALIRSQSETGKELADCLGTDAESFAVGCVLRFLTLGVSTGNRDTAPPAVDAVRWLGEGAALALKRGEHSELLPTDLVRAVQEGTIARSVRRHLSRAAGLGAVRRDVILGSRSVSSIPTTPPTPEDIVKDIEKVETGRAAAGSTDLSDLDVVLDEFENQRQILASIEKRLTHLQKQLRAPSGARLAAAIVLVLTLGVAAGLALQFPQPWGSLLAQVFSASVK
jgi:hypothetical protein